VTEPTTEAGRRHWALHAHSAISLPDILAIEAEARATVPDVAHTTEYGHDRRLGLLPGCPACDAEACRRMTKPLTPRQAEALWRLGSGRSYTEAAGDMGITYQSFKNTTHDAYTSLGVSTVLQAMQALGWITLPEAPPAVSRVAFRASRSGGAE
jgi:DNA-binding CsgD family transcriptional regulator